MATDPTLVVLEATEKCFLLIVRGWQARDTVTDEQALPALANRLQDVLCHGCLVRVIRRFLLQVLQEGLDFSFDLTGLAALSGIIFQPQVMG
jgi:hypothetical protein